MQRRMRFVAPALMLAVVLVAPTEPCRDRQRRRQTRSRSSLVQHRQRRWLMGTTRSTVELLKKHGFKPVFLESEGAHTWLNWRDYLAAFAPQLF